MSERSALENAAASSRAAPPDDDPARDLDRNRQFRVTYVAVVLFLLLYLFTVQVVEGALQLHFEQVVAEAIDIEVGTRHPGQEIRLNLTEKIGFLDWVDFWDIDIDVRVLAADESTWLYVDDRARVPRYEDRSPAARIALHRTLLPASAEAEVNVHHNTMLSNTILIAYGAMMFFILFLYNRRIVSREEELLEEARSSRDAAAARAQAIETEIETVRARLREVEPAKREDREEIARLQNEQQDLQSRLDALAARERALRSEAERAAALEEEGRTLEELLEEASEDISLKNMEIQELEQNLKKAGRTSGASGGKSKESEILTRRMKALYPRLDIDDRAIDDLVSLGDELTKLRAEECLKKLDEEADNRGVRRKVGGLPNHLSVYEVGFAGKRRLYYTKSKGESGRVRVLAIGAKNTQQSDLDYISRLPKSEFIDGLPTTSQGKRR